MDTKTALGAAGGISLTVVGAVSALVLTLGGGTSILDGSTNQPSSTVVEYVDQYGNPVDLQQPAALPEVVVTTDAPAVKATATETMAAGPADPTTFVEVEAYDDHAESDEYEGDHEEDDDD